MFEKKRGTRFLASVMALVMLLSLAPVGALAAGSGEETEVSISWTKSTNAVQGGIANNLGDCLNLETDVSNSNDVWNSQDGNGATYNSGSNSVQRFRGTFTIPNGYSAASSFKLYSAKQETYRNHGCAYDGVIPINDNIYVFVYPEGTTITAQNASNYLAFYGGNSCGNDFLGTTSLAAGSGRYGQYDNYLGELGEVNQTLWDDMQSTDGWFIQADLDNIGKKITELIASGSASEGATFVIDVFAENNSDDDGGGLDRLVLSASNPATAKVVVRYYKDSVTPDNNIKTEVVGTGKLAGNTVNIDVDTYKPEHYQSGVPQNNIQLSDGKYAVTEEDVTNSIKYIDVLYTPIMYSVTYTDGVEDEEVFEDQVESDLAYGTKTPAFNKTLTRAGYTFTGWSPEVQSTVTQNATYEAQWEKIPDPEPVQSTDVYVYFRVVNTKDENVSIDGLSVKYNANAGGNTWCTFGKISTTKELTLNNVKQDAETQLTATNAQIHADNAGIKDEVLSNVTWYQLGTWAGAPGYHDSGTYWHLDGKITGYTVTYASEGTPQNMPQNDVKYYLSNTTYTISNTVPTRTGYTFAGWKSNITNDNKTYKADGENTSITIPKQNVVLTAQWTPNTYKVTYTDGVDNEDVFTDVVRDVNYNSTIPAFGEQNPVRIGYTFNGWTSSVEGVQPGDLMPNQDVIFTATWNINSYSVTYEYEGNYPENAPALDSLNNNVLVPYGQTVTVDTTVPAATVSGYTFSGWKIGTEDAGTQFSMPANNVVLKGSWTANGDTKCEYVVEHYKWNGTNYKLADFDRFSALEGTKVTAIAKSYENEGYMLNPQAPDTIKEGTVVKPTLENVLTLKLYYDIDKIGGGENKDQPDNIPDRYQVTINYVSSNESWGTVSPLSKEVITLKDGEKLVEEATIKTTASTATSAGGRCYFVNWTKKQEGSTASSTVISSANLPAQTIENAKGGDVYTFTANFDRSSGGGSGGSNRPKPPVVEIPDDVPTGLNGKDHYAYIIGYGNNDVRPQNNITRAEVATIFFRLLTDETREANMTKSNSYNDMKDGAWYTCAVSTLSKMGIIKGYEDGSFKPDASISRAEFAAIAARFDPDGDKTPATFSDVSSHWAKDEISIAANHGWIKGYEDGSFKPDQKITRAETMTLVNRVLNRLPETKDDLHKDMKTWVDNMDETAWYYLAVQEATNSHYFKNKTSTKFEQWTDLRDTRDWSELEK